MTQNQPSRARRHSELADNVGRRVSELQAMYRRDMPGAVASLARLRQAVGTLPGESPAAWSETLGVLGNVGHDTDEPTRQEWAAHLALTLFALHQQAHRDADMHRKGLSLGHSARRLAVVKATNSQEASQAVLRRFQMLGTSMSLTEVGQHARGLVAQLRVESIPLDYGLLTDHLMRLQDPRTAPSVRLAWGRDYYRIRADKPDGTESTPDDDPQQGDPA